MPKMPISPRSPPSDQIVRQRTRKISPGLYRPSRSRSRTPEHKRVQVHYFTEDGNTDYDFLQYLAAHNYDHSENTNDSLYREYLKEKKIAKRGHAFTYSPGGQDDMFSMRLMRINSRLVWKPIEYTIY